MNKRKPVDDGAVRDFRNKDLRRKDFGHADLSYSTFSGSDLRGANFSSANLTGTVFSNVKIGITTSDKSLIFFLAFVTSVISGLVAVMAGATVQKMIASEVNLIRIAGFLTLGLTLAFVIVSMWKGPGKSFAFLIAPVCVTAALIGIIAYFTGLGTGEGMFYLVICLLQVQLMFIVGTIARVAAGSMSNILFVVIALAGGLSSKTVGGGIGAMILGISCGVVSKRALAGVKNFDTLARIAMYVTARFGTSFRNATLSWATFSQSVVRNADFSNADLSGVSWDKCQQINCKK